MDKKKFIFLIYVYKTKDFVLGYFESKKFID